MTFRPHHPEAPNSPIAPAPLPPYSRRGVPYPQGATWDGNGVNFSIFALNADAVDLCLFDDPSAEKESRRIRIEEQTNDVWHIYVPDARPGQLYGYRVHGPFRPEEGLRYNPNKLLLDPYAKAIGRPLSWDDSLFGYTIGDPAGDLSFDERDSAAHAPLGVVIDNRFDWGGDTRPMIPWHETIIYEAHVKGMTWRHPGVPEHLRGTYAGLACDPIIEHLQTLGITAIELMPIHYFTDDRHLVERGLSNYWGYNTLGFFAPNPEYGSDQKDPKNAVCEFREMVCAYHRAGIEVFLDVVYNHTAEGNEMGPTLSFRGIDNLSYYRTVPNQARYYMDYTGCGNTLNMVHPHSLRLLMDSLRYWVTEMHVDGFRFDLASALARELHDVDHLGAFFDTIYQDPVISTVKLIAEPWDLGEGGYQVGNFPLGWAEWNGRYRDDVRRFWKGDMGMHGAIATRLGGSSDLYDNCGRLPSASINFVTAHDGFTLRDLVSYNDRHNEANGENGADGASDNNSWNCGAEGDTDDAGILALRRQQQRNFLATLLLSQGVPMICGGDEIGRTQQGNNNGYCQDSELSWHDWDLDDERSELFSFASMLVDYRRKHPNFRRRSFRERTAPGDEPHRGIEWFGADGKLMTDEAWHNGGWMRTVGMFLPGDSPEIRNAENEQVLDDDFLLILNAHHKNVRFRLPDDMRDSGWEIAVNTARPEGEKKPHKVRKEQSVAARSLVVLRRKRQAHQ